MQTTTCRISLRICATTLLLAVFAAGTGPATAQTPAMKPDEAEVWKVIERVWQLAGEKRMEDVMSHYHPAWHRWGYHVPDLWDHQHLTAFLRESNEGAELSSALQPHLIQLHGDAALVHYVSRVRGRLGSGAPIERAVRFSDFLVRDGGQWRIIGGYRDDQCALSPSPWATDWVCDRPELDVSGGNWEERPLSPADMEKYVGSYVADGEEVRVWIENGHLRITPGDDGRPRIELVPMGSHVFAQGRYDEGVLREIYYPNVRVVFVEADGAIQRYELRIGDTAIEVGHRVR